MSDTVKLTINRREVTVPRGTTILEAAEQLGIPIPTLCYLKGTKPMQSCFICVVRVDGEPRLSPACSTEVSDGMVVSSESEEVREARRTGLELLLSEHHGDCEGPCTMACPADLDIPAMIDHIDTGDMEKAVTVARRRMLFNAVLGRICPAFCERACRRAELDEPVSIASLQRLAGDAGIERKVTAEAAAATGRKVAVIGAGPAGLTAAYHLLLRGHACTLFDGNREPGGMWRYGIPEFRLPKRVLEGEVDVVRRLGGEFRMETALGVDLSLWGRVRGEFDAVLLATGAPTAVPFECEGAELAQSAVSFLRHVNDGSRTHAGPSVVVIGSGDPAVDAARAAARLGAETVTLFCGKARNQAGCPSDRIDAAEAEGVEAHFSSHVVSIRQVEAGRFRVTADEGKGLLPVLAEHVIAAGERAADTALAEALRLHVGRRGIAADPKTFLTNIDAVFAAGECVRGPTHGVQVVAAGRRAAAAVHQYLTGPNTTGEAKAINVRMGRLNEEELAIIRRTADRATRTPAELLDAAHRCSTFEEVQSGLSPDQAVVESGRCLRCDCAAREDCKLRRYCTEYAAGTSRYKGAHREYGHDISHETVVYEPNKCILCGLCIRTAVEASEPLGLSFLGRGFATTMGVPFEKQLSEGLKVAAERCVKACPTGALAFKSACEKRKTGG